MEVDAAIQDERAVKFDFHTGAHVREEADEGLGDAHVAAVGHGVVEGRAAVYFRRGGSGVRR